MEGITLSSGILMTIFCRRSVSSTFTPQTPSPLVPSPSIPQSLRLSFLLSPETNYSPPSPAAPIHPAPDLCPLTMLSAKYSHKISRNRTARTHSGAPYRSPPSWSLFQSLAQPVVFVNGGFCPFHVLENKRFLCTRDGGKLRDGEQVREEDILLLSVSIQ